ncbi:benzyl alcohol O-benzoyltransferase-like [Typha latifolia]|uniref:benzyl alcohol O-benzoyltransferase-like n=1 Tax=Typha latifolia TaxID=4733 RepID=UPI003C2B8F08
MAMPSYLTFKSRRSEPVLVGPAKPTPHEIKLLSDIDDQEGIRFYRSGIHIYRSHPSKVGQDPAKIIKAALADVLVYYYPIAGRIREESGRKLVVECNGEGIVFVEADVDVSVDDFGDVISPPIPCYQELLCEPDSASAVVVDRPLLYIQVTRLSCGGFVFGLQLCHNIADAAGVVQLLKAIAELARGAEAPSVQPVWARELLCARSPPRVTHQHPEYEEVTRRGKEVIRAGDAGLIHRAFFFGPKEMSTLRQRAPPQIRCSRFDLLAAFVWRCRTVALGYDPCDEVRIQFVVNARGRRNPPLPVGFYGNAFAFAVASTTAGELCGRPYSYALEQVMKAKAKVTDEFLQSVADLMVVRGRPRFTTAQTYLVSDLTRAGFEEVDFGWGEGVYGGAATANLATFHIKSKNGRGEEGIGLPMCLPAPAMERFALEIASLTEETTFDRQSPTPVLDNHSATYLISQLSN